MGHEEQRGSLGVILYSVPVKKGWSRVIAVLKGGSLRGLGAFKASDLRVCGQNIWTELKQPAGPSPSTGPGSPHTVCPLGRLPMARPGPSSPGTRDVCIVPRINKRGRATLLSVMSSPHDVRKGEGREGTTWGFSESRERRQPLRQDRVPSRRAPPACAPCPGRGGASPAQPGPAAARPRGRALTRPLERCSHAPQRGARTPFGLCASARAARDPFAR